ncbi:MAG: hypothetical protein GQ570_11320 [Helicobacteraceae bacterium]|nr:hypothetical protein [Helicobacteraceae bacterium]
MAKRIKSKKYTGIYYRELEDGDRVFEFTYKDLEGKKKWIKVGLKSHNINEAFANRKRIKTISKIKLDGDEPDFIKKRKLVQEISLNAVANRTVGGVQGKLPTYNIESLKIICPKKNIMDAFTNLIDAINNNQKRYLLELMNLLQIKEVLLLKMATIK